jgi:N-acetyl sugar amidotransferase
MSRPYQICSRCIMDTSDPEIRFDTVGACNHCTAAFIACAALPQGTNVESELARVVTEIRASGRGREYDCLVGISGGVDSTYVAYRAKQLGLRCLAVHFDSGWNSELAVKNIEQTVKQLDIDLHTFVCNWDEMRDVQLSFFKASIPNCDIPQDHAIVAALYRVAAQHGIRSILTGSNVTTESILPTSWVYNNLDARHIRGVQRCFGSIKLRKFPLLDFWHYYFIYPKLRRIRMVKFLNLLGYNRETAMQTLQAELGWRYYGGKHYESVFTRFFQGYYLPTKFGYDKRRAHLSSLIAAGELTRADALEQLSHNPYLEGLVHEDRVFVAKKFGLTEIEYDAILSRPPRSHLDYPNSAWIYRLKDRVKHFVARDSHVR